MLDSDRRMFGFDRRQWYGTPKLSEVFDTRDIALSDGAVTKLDNQAAQVKLDSAHKETSMQSRMEMHAIQNVHQNSAVQTNGQQYRGDYYHRASKVKTGPGCSPDKYTNITHSTGFPLISDRIAVSPPR